MECPLTSGCSLQIEDQCLVEFDLSSLSHLILIHLRYALVLCHSFKSCALPPSLLFHALFLSRVWAHNIASTIFWRNKQKIAGPWEENTVSSLSRYSGLHLPCFLQHVQQQHLSLNPLGWVTGTPVKSPSVGNPSRATGLPGMMFATLGVNPAGHLGPLTTLLLKVTKIPLDQISTPLLWNIWSVASYQFVLKPLTNSYN